MSKKTFVCSRSCVPRVDDRRSSPAQALTAAINVNTNFSERYYNVRELMRLSGLTRKKVSYWEKIGLVVPVRRASRGTRSKPSIFYPAAQVLKALIICELLRLGLSLPQVQDLACNLQELDVELYESQAYLLTDGYSIYYAFSDGQVVDVHKNHRQMLLLVPLHEQVAKLQEVA